MSNIVFLTPPAHGHLNPALPVMQELVQRGKRVICYNNPDFRHQIEQAGVLFRAYPTTILTADAISESLAGGNLSKPHLLMLQAAEQLTPFVIDELQREPVDLVVFDSLAVWGKIAANKLNLKAAATISHFVFDLSSMKLNLREYATMMWQFFSQVSNLLRARRRLMQQFGSAYPSAQPLFPMRDHLNIVYTARELQPSSSIIDDTFRFVGPAINPQVRSSDFPFESLADKPLVYISLGTVHGNPAFYKSCFQAFADYPAQFVMPVGRHTNIAELGTLPTNFIVQSHVPQIEILQRADVFITHGGINSVHEGLYYGVPLIVFPQQFEQMLNARCVTAHGVGLILDEQLRGKNVTVAKLRETLHEVLTTSSYTEKAKTVQTILNNTGGYRQAADELQAYIG